MRAQKGLEHMQVEETQTSMTNTGMKPTRASFIRSLPLAMPVDEVIERGREVGIQVQPSDIHAARYYMRQQSAAETASKPPTIAQQLMLGGTISAQRDQDETVGLTKIAGVRNGANGGTRAVVTAPAAPAAPVNKVTAPSAGKRQTEREPRVQTRSARSDKDKRSERAEKAVGSARTHIEISIDDVLKSAATPKSRGGRRAPGVNGSMEEQLHTLVLRLGTQRAREIIEEIEQTALTAS
jgi:hypothetical protein